MTDPWRISVDDSYLRSLGRAIYHFQYLEWGVVYLCERLEPGYIHSVKGKTSKMIARDFERLAPTWTGVSAVAARLVGLAKSFLDLADRRNGLVHATPYTEHDSSQQLGYSGRSGEYKWSGHQIDALALDCQNAAIEANDLFHNHLNK
jgi:hypothetical protein